MNPVNYTFAASAASDANRAATSAGVPSNVQSVTATPMHFYAHPPPQQSQAMPAGLLGAPMGPPSAMPFAGAHPVGMMPTGAPPSAHMPFGGMAPLPAPVAPSGGSVPITAAVLLRDENDPTRNPELHLLAPYFDPSKWADEKVLASFSYAEMFPGGIPCSAISSLEWRLRWVTADSDFLEGPASSEACRTAHLKRLDYYRVLYSSLRTRPNMKAPQSTAVDGWFLRAERDYSVVEQVCERFFPAALSPFELGPRFLVSTRPILCLNFRFHREFLSGSLAVAEFEHGQRSSDRVMVPYARKEAAMMNASSRLLRYPCTPPWWYKYEVSHGLDATYGTVFSYVSGALIPDPSHPLWTAALNEWVVEVGAAWMRTLYRTFRFYYLSVDLRYAIFDLYRGLADKFGNEATAYEFGVYVELMASIDFSEGYADRVPFSKDLAAPADPLTEKYFYFDPFAREVLFKSDANARLQDGYRSRDPRPQGFSYRELDRPYPWEGCKPKGSGVWTSPGCVFPGLYPKYPPVIPDTYDVSHGFHSIWRPDWETGQDGNREAAAGVAESTARGDDREVERAEAQPQGVEADSHRGGASTQGAASVASVGDRGGTVAPEKEVVGDSTLGAAAPVSCRASPAASAGPSSQVGSGTLDGVPAPRAQAESPVSLEQIVKDHARGVGQAAKEPVQGRAPRRSVVAAGGLRSGAATVPPRQKKAKIAKSRSSSRSSRRTASTAVGSSGKSSSAATRAARSANNSPRRLASPRRAASRASSAIASTAEASGDEDWAADRHETQADVDNRRARQEARRAEAEEAQATEARGEEPSTPARDVGDKDKGDCSSTNSAPLK